LVDLCFQPRREARPGYSGKGEIDGRGVKAGGEPRRSDAHLLDGDALDLSQGLRNAPHTSAAVHSINMQLELGHLILPYIFDDTPMGMDDPLGETRVHGQGKRDGKAGFD